MRVQVLARPISTQVEKAMQSSVANGVPPLESADRLTRAEFERRYELHPEIKKAERIEGVVDVASPIRARQHGGPHFDGMGWDCIAL